MTYEPATFDNRPTVRPPVDDAHAFLNEPLRVNDPDLLGWLKHFRAQGSDFPWQYAELGRGMGMIYVHQVRSSGRWCCT